VPIGTGEFHLQGNYQYQSSQNTTFNNFATTIVNGVLTKNGASSTFARIPETHNISISAAYDIGNFEFGVFGNNLANGVKVTNIGRATYYQIYQAGSVNTYARPRTIGGRVKIKF
jgi:iron complex outermembrane receptor protein